MRPRKWVWMKGGATYSVPGWNASVINGNDGRSRGMRRIYKLWYTDNHTMGKPLMFDHWRSDSRVPTVPGEHKWDESARSGSRSRPPRDTFTGTSPGPREPILRQRRFSFHLSGVPSSVILQPIPFCPVISSRIRHGEFVNWLSSLGNIVWSFRARGTRFFLSIVEPCWDYSLRRGDIQFMSIHFSFSCSYEMKKKCINEIVMHKGVEQIFR